MPPTSREDFTVRVLHAASTAPAGVGFVVGPRHVITCAHVVNTALGLELRAQEKPGPDARVQIDFPLLGDADEPPPRSCRVAAWVPPPPAGLTGGDVAGLVVVGGGLPAKAGPARLADSAIFLDADAHAFGYPGDPPGRDNGDWTLLGLRGTVGGGVVQLDVNSEAAIRAQPGHSGSPVVVNDSAGDAVIGMLAVAGKAAGTRDSYAIPVSQLADAWPEVLAKAAMSPCPYRGLLTFTADDAKAGLFVGREKEISQLRQLIGRHGFVVVAGPSGVGKSSLVHAGVFRAMQQDGWVTASFRPGGEPLFALAKALFGLEQPRESPTVATLKEWGNRVRSIGLAAAGSQLAVLRGAPVLICVDQLEEVLDPGICPLEKKREFLDLVLAMWVEQGGDVRLVGTLRADFVSALLEYPEAGTYLRDRLFTLSPMGSERLERVIAEPAAAEGVAYQEALVPLIANDAGGGAGLPLLEFALTELWPHQRQHQITLADYRAIGGVTGALSRYAERVYQELLGQFAADKIRRVMLSLVRSRGGASEATRIAASKSDLGTDWPVAEALAARRLLVISHDHANNDDIAEIAHEAVIRVWPLFAKWVDDDASFQHWRSALEERAAEGDLLHDSRIAEADRWLSSRPDEISEKVRQLIEKSRSLWNRRVAELVDARTRAETAAGQAEARRLAAAAELVLASRALPLQVAIALAVESLRMSPGLEGQMALQHAIRGAPVQRSCLRHRAEVRAVAFSPNGPRVATGSGDRTLRVFDAETGRQVCCVDHGGAVVAVAFSPDGTRVASGSRDRSLRVFDAETGRQVCCVGHGGAVVAVAFSPDSARVATASFDGAARVFDAETGQQVCCVDHGGAVVDVAFSLDGARVATASFLGNARVFDAVTGQEACRVEHGGAVVAVAFSPDGTKVASASGDGTARVFDAAGGAEVCRLDYGSWVDAVAFSPNGTHVAAGNLDGSARVFDAITGAEVCRLEHRSAVLTVAFSPDGTLVATGSGDGSARVFDAVAGTQMCRMDHDDEVGAVAFSPDGTLVATGSGDGSARVFDATAGAEVCRVNHGDAVFAVAFSRDGTRVASASSDGSARVFNASDGTKVCRMDQGPAVIAVAFSHDSRYLATGNLLGSARVFDLGDVSETCRFDQGTTVYAVAFSPDGSRVATGSGDGSARVFDTIARTEIGRLDHNGAVAAVAFSHDGSRVATASFDRTARVFDAATGAQQWCLDHDDEVSAVAFSPDDSLVATASFDASARLFDAGTGTQVSRLEHFDTVVAVAFSPDGASLATGSRDGTARVFDTVTGAEVCRLVHGDSVVAVAFSPDGASLATGSRDGTARVFDTVTGAEVCRLEHGDNVNAVAFSPDGTCVATGSRDHGARVWFVDRGQLVNQAESRLTRNLTQPEWRRYFGDHPYRKTRADLP